MAIVKALFFYFALTSTAWAQSEPSDAPPLPSAVPKKAIGGSLFIVGLIAYDLLKQDNCSGMSREGFSDLEVEKCRTRSRDDQNLALATIASGIGLFVWGASDKHDWDFCDGLNRDRSAISGQTRFDLLLFTNRPALQISVDI